MMTSCCSSKMQRAMATMMIIAIVTAMFCSFALAADPTAPTDAIEDGVKTGLSQLYSIMTKLVVPVAVVVLAWCAFKVFAGGQKGMEEAKKTALITIIVIAIVYLAPLIVQQVASWFESSMDTSVFD